MSASHSASTSDFIALAHTMAQLRTLASDLSTLSAFEGWMPNVNSESQFERHAHRTRTAELGSGLYLQLARAAMELVGKSYDTTPAPAPGAVTNQMLQQIGVDLSAVPVTIQVAHVLPVIEEASQLMKVITLSVQPLAARSAPMADRQTLRQVFH